MQDKLEKGEGPSRSLGTPTLVLTQACVMRPNLSISYSFPLRRLFKIINYCSGFKYLKSYIRVKAGMKIWLSSRVIQSRIAIKKLNSIFWSSKIIFHTKVWIYRSSMEPITIYREECRQLTTENKYQLKTEEMNFLCRVYTVSGLDHFRNHTDIVRQRPRI